MSEPAKDRAGRRRRGPRAQGASKPPTEAHQEPIDGTAALSELFPDWIVEDLQVVLQESLNDVTEAVRRITEGLAMKSVQVKSKREVRDRREQENKEAAREAREAREASRREPRVNGKSANPSKKPTTQAPNQAQPQKAAAPKPQPTATKPQVTANTDVNTKAESSSLVADGKMSWAQAVRQNQQSSAAAVPSKQAEEPKPTETAAAPVKQETQKPKAQNKPVSKASVDTAAKTSDETPAGSGSEAPSSASAQTIEKTESKTPAAQAADGSKPARPDGKMSWAAALAVDAAPKLAPTPAQKSKQQPQQQQEQQEQEQVKQDSKEDAKQEKKQDFKQNAKQDSAEEEKQEEQGDKKAERNEKKSRSNKNKKKGPSPSANEVTKQVEKLELPRGPAAEQQQPKQAEPKQSSVGPQAPRKGPEIPKGPAVQARDAPRQPKEQTPQRQAAQAPAQQGPPSKAQQPVPQPAQQQYMPQPYQQMPAPAAQPQPGQQVPHGQEMPQQMFMNPYMAQFGMPGMPPLPAQGMSPYAIPVQGQPAAQGQQQMPGMPMPMYPAMPAMTPAHGAAPAPSMPQQAVPPQQGGQDYAGYIPQYNPYGFTPRGYDYGYDQSGAYMYPQYGYNAYPPQMAHPLVPQHPDSPHAQQLNMYMQAPQYGNQPYNDHNAQQRHWSE